MELKTALYLIRAGTNLYLALLNTVFIRVSLTPKDRFSNRSLFWGTFAVAMGHLVVNMFLYGHQAMKLITAVLFLAFGTGIFYRDKWIRRAGIGVVFMFLVFLSEGLLASLLAGIYGVSITEYTDQNVFSMTLLLGFIYTLFFGAATLISWKRSRWKNEKNHGDLDRFFILPLSQLVVVTAFMSSVYIDSQSVGLWDGVVTLIVMVLCVVTDLVFLRMIDTLVWQKQKEEQQELEKRHYTAMMEQQRSVRKMRHDIANHLMAIELMVSENDPGAKEYSRRLMQEVQKTQMVDRCENQVADAVLYSKAAEASAGQIEFKADAQLSQTAAIDDLDLMSLLSNLLDNALTAASQAERKWVSVQIREQAGTVLFVVQNSIKTKTVPNLNQSSKPNKSSHGLGIGIIREICGRYNGTFDTTLGDDSFEVSVMLLLSEEAL